jgi:hypothetical protein
MVIDFGKPGPGLGLVRVAPQDGAVILENDGRGLFLHDLLLELRFLAVDF